MITGTTLYVFFLVVLFIVPMLMGFADGNRLG